MSDVFGCFMLGEELYVESEYSGLGLGLGLDRQSIMMICDMLQDDLESSTFRNRAYFFFMFYLHDISIVIKISFVYNC